MRNLQQSIGWLALIPNPIIQTNEAWFLTNTEKVHQLFCKIIEIIDTVNSTNDLLRKLKDVLNEFDETVKYEVEKYIKELYDNGELGNIVKKTIAESLVISNTTIDPIHMARVLHYAHYWEAPNYGDDTYDVERYSYAQGNCCFIAEDGNKYWVVAYICSNGSHFDYNNNAMLYVYKVNSNNTMTYKSRVLLANVGHANGLCYHQGYIYITPNSYQLYNESTKRYSGVLTTDVHRFKFDTVNASIEINGETKTPTIQLQDNNWTDLITSSGDKLYFTDGYLNIYEYDWDNNNAQLVHSNIGGTYTLRPQNAMCINSNYIYFLGRDQRLYRYNRNLEIVDLCYKLPMYCNDNQFKIGEIEGISLIGNIMYFGACYNLGSSKITNGVAVTRFLCQDINTNGMQPTMPSTTTINWTSGATNNVTLYVSGDKPSDTDNPKNPFGLLENDGFSCVQECLDFIEGNEWIKRANIVVYQRLNQIPIDIKTDKCITISGSKYFTDNGERPYISRITSVGTNGLLLIDLCIRNFMAEDVLEKINPSDGSNSVIYLTRSVCALSKIYAPVGSQHSKVKYLLNAPSSFISFAEPVTTEAQWKGDGSQGRVYIYNSGGMCNAHGNATLNNDIIA